MGQEEGVEFCKSRVWFLFHPNFLDGVAFTGGSHQSRRGHTRFVGNI